MRVIVTCGPSHEPIDQVRRLTNFSTGELGLVLSAALTRAGHTVICLKGEGATAQVAAAGAKIVTFSTNEDLLQKLEAEAGAADAVFHAAALCDYRVKQVRTADGTSLDAAKIPTRSGELTLILEPTVKVLPRLRAIFPKAKIVGWKYELDGTLDHALVLRSWNHLRAPGLVVRRLVDALRPGGSLLVVDNVAFGLARTRAQTGRAERSSAGFEHFRDDDAGAAHRTIAEAAGASLALVERRDVGPGTANQWLLRYARVEA
jgi:SAM-dependent methyltransferase